MPPSWFINLPAFSFAVWMESPTQRLGNLCSNPTLCQPSVSAMPAPSHSYGRSQRLLEFEYQLQCVNHSLILWNSNECTVNFIEGRARIVRLFWRFFLTVYELGCKTCELFLLALSKKIFCVHRRFSIGQFNSSSTKYVYDHESVDSQNLYDVFCVIGRGHKNTTKKETFIQIM